MSVRAIALMTVSVLCIVAFKSNAQTRDNGLPVLNPFSSAGELPYETTPFDKIKDADYKPAFEAGLKEQLADIEKIANNPAAPSFENTLVAMEKSGQLFGRVSRAFNAVSGANTNPALQKLSQEMAPKLAANQNAIFLNSKLFRRIETIYNQRNSLKLDAESVRLVERTYQRFVLAGARLSEENKQRIKKLNEEEAALSAQFSNQLVEATKDGALVIENESELAGLSPSEIAACAKAATDRGLKGKWVISLQNTTQQPLLSSLTVRETRRKLFEASWKRAEKADSNDTRAAIVRLAAVRAEKAKIMGFKTYAHWKTQDQMAENPETVDKFFAQLVPAVTAKANVEAADIQSLIDQQKGGFQLAPWDWDFYAEQVRKAKYELDENEVKPYFEINKVLEEGVFFAASQLYGLSFKERKDIPTYHPDIRVYEVFDQDGQPLALFYGDYFKRDNKRGGAWCSSLVGQSKLLKTKPVVYNVCNLPKPAPGEPALISFDNVRTMFHEFGHALHAIFSDQTYPSLSGTNVARDFVEFPSQFNEHWALDPKVLQHYAIHFKTGQPIPSNLIEKIKKASSFNNGYALTEAIAASMLDLQWHKLPAGTEVKDVVAFEKKALHQAGLDLPQVPPRYRSSYFSHIWGSGYAAGYYAYQWTKMLEQDAYSWFEENGGLTRANGQRFREMILSRGNSLEYKEMYRAFRGHDANIEAMVKNLGLGTF